MAKPVDVLGLIRAELRDAFIPHFESVRFHPADGLRHSSNVVECK
jgi:hypothetical protein